MSAYVVGADLIDLIVTAADKLGRREYRGGFTVYFAGGMLEYSTADDLTAMGAELYYENVASVNHRYGDTEPLPAYVFRPVHGLGESIAANYWDVLSGIRCVRYQSCEHAEWGGSYAAAILDRVESLVIGHLMPDTASWEWTRREGQERIEAARARVKLEVGTK